MKKLCIEVEITIVTKKTRSTFTSVKIPKDIMITNMFNW